MNRSASGAPRLSRALVLLLCLLLACAGHVFAEAPESPGFTLSLPKEVKGYSRCVLTLQAPAAGELLLTLYDSLDNPWLYRKETLVPGENRLSWDGLGSGGERLLSGPYRFEAVLRGADGGKWTASAAFRIQGFEPALSLALPSSDVLYLDQKERWFVECWAPVECIAAMEILNEKGAVVYSVSQTLKDPDRDVFRWNGVGRNNKKVAPGEYTVRLLAKRNPAFAVTFPLTVRETAPETPPVSVTGPVIPDRSMTDAEIWEIMMKPSVVINATGSALRFSLRSEPSYRSPAAGTVCCATQGLEILSVEGDWAQVRAWNYDDARQIVTGWYPLRELTTVAPAPHYAVLVDKRYQTLTVWQDGAPIGTVPVSTGLPTKAVPSRETPAGAFLTDVHFSPTFVQDGARYDYPLRYQGGNIIHSTGFVRIPHTTYSVKDYSKNLPLLGQKASHGCIRVSPFATADCPINSYWLWSRLPYHTRVIVLDD